MKHINRQPFNNLLLIRYLFNLYITNYFNFIGTNQFEIHSDWLSVITEANVKCHSGWPG